MSYDDLLNWLADCLLFCKSIFVTWFAALMDPMSDVVTLRLIHINTLCNDLNWLADCLLICKRIFTTSITVASGLPH